MASKLYALSQEEDNYVRMTLLLTGISPRAVRVLFDKEFPPASLSLTFNDKKVKQKLNDLSRKRIINKAQWDLLFPTSGITDSKTFDVTLMIVLLRNLPTLPLVPPVNGYDQLPVATETTPASDLARIKHYRMLLAHLHDGKVDGALFTSACQDISDAVRRLGGSILHDECRELRTRQLDQSTVPWNIRVQIYQILEAWKDNDVYFVETRASKHVLECIQNNSCVTMTASAGVGKTAILQHVALKMKDEGFNTLLITSPHDIVKFYNPNQKTLFVVDDFCGTFSINQSDLNSWETVLNRIQFLIQNKLTKIIVACRLQVYQDDKFAPLSIFRKCVCNLLSKDLCLSQSEKNAIAHLYLGLKASEIIEYCDLYECFPLLCKLYQNNRDDLNITDFFKNPFSEGYLSRFPGLAFCTALSTPRNIPKEIWRMDDDSIRIYIDALKSGSEIKKDIRVIIVGKKGAGKTCLVRKLLGQNLDTLDSTNGIDIHVNRCKIRTADGKWIFQDGNLNSDIHHRILKSMITHTKANDLSMSVSEIEQEQYKCGNEEKYDNLEAIKLAETPNQIKDTHSVIFEDAQTLTTVPANDTQEMPLGGIGNPYYIDLKEIIDSEKDMDSEEYATVCLWDFAGDKEFYNTHQTFLSKEAIYLVVTNLNETDDETNETFKFWFDSVHFYGATHDTHEDYVQVTKKALGSNIETKNSDDNTNSSQIDESDSMSSCMETTALENVLEPPIIAVGTHKDQSTDNFKEALADKIRDYLGDSVARQHLRDCHYVSNTTDEDHIFEALRRRIYEISKNRSNFGKMLPVRFIRLEKSINENLQSGKQFLSFGDIKAIAEANETITDVAELDVFLRYQHGFGNMIYYKDIPEYIILNPQWLVNAFRVLVTADKYQERLIGHKEWDTYANYGELGDNLLNCIFESQTKDIKECKGHILKIMEKFDIIVRPKMLINGKEHVESHYYVPCMIKTMTSKDIQKQLKTPHQKSFCLCLEFNFLPPVFINHLIISCIRKFHMSKVVGQKKNARPALFRHTALFDVGSCEKLFVASFQNVIQIQIWKYDSKKRSPYIDIRNFIQSEVDKIIEERYGMIHIKYELSLKCDRTSYDIVDGTQNLVNMKDDEDFYCEEHDEMHVYKDDWFNEEQKTKKAVQCQTEQENVDCKKKKDISSCEILYFRTKVQTASTALLDLNLDETSSTTVSHIAHKEQSEKESFTADEFNFAKMGKIVLNILRDALFDLLKLDKHGDPSYQMPDRSQSDITSLYKEHRKLNMHVPSYSSTRPDLWGGKWTDIAITDTGLGDDIERIRLTRNELQHAHSFSVDDARYKELCVILHDLLNRFDQNNMPSSLYTKRMNEVLLIAFDRDEIEDIKHKFEHSLKRKTDCKVETDCKTQVEIECEIKIPK